MTQHSFAGQAVDAGWGAAVSCVLKYCSMDCMEFQLMPPEALVPGVGQGAKKTELEVDAVGAVVEVVGDAAGEPFEPGPYSCCRICTMRWSVC